MDPLRYSKLAGCGPEQSGDSTLSRRCSTGPLQSQLFCDTLSIISRISSAAKFTAQKHNFFKNKTPLLHIIYLIFFFGQTREQKSAREVHTRIFPTYPENSEPKDSQSEQQAQLMSFSYTQLPISRKHCKGFPSSPPAIFQKPFNLSSSQPRPVLSSFPFYFDPHKASSTGGSSRDM